MSNCKKILCAIAALCPFGTALASVSKIDVSAQENQSLCSFEEVMSPIWKGATSYMETVLPVGNAYGGIDPISLLYPIEEIIEVKNAELTVTYKEGVDYVVSGGKLIIADDGNIPVLSYRTFHPTTGQAGFEDVNGGYICFHEEDYFHQKQIVVTYTHTKAYDGYVPESKQTLLPNITEKLQAGKDIDLLVFGDSISVGANSSGFVGASPYLPNYAQLFAMQMEKTYGGKVNLTNPSVGGKGVNWGLSEIDDILSGLTNLDLAVLAFGMNDGHMFAVDFAQKKALLVEKVKEKFPNADVMVLATMLPNPDAKNFNKNQSLFHDALVEACEKEGVAVVNMTGMHASLLQKKRYADMTGNNVNHPNDYLARVYAQTLFATLQEEVVEEEEIPTEESVEQDTTVLDQLLSGCSGSASIGLTVAAMGTAAATLKKKKDD